MAIETFPGRAVSETKIDVHHGQGVDPEVISGELLITIVGSHIPDSPPSFVDFVGF